MDDIICSTFIMSVNDTIEFASIFLAFDLVGSIGSSGAFAVKTDRVILDNWYYAMLYITQSDTDMFNFVRELII